MYACTLVCVCVCVCECICWIRCPQGQKLSHQSESEFDGPNKHLWAPYTHVYVSETLLLVHMCVFVFLHSLNFTLLHTIVVAVERLQKQIHAHIHT